MTAKRAAIYCRISEDRAGAGLGVERQEADCRSLAQRLGWTVVDVYRDNDVSAYSGKPRPEYRRMLTDLEDRRANAVLVWHTDRLHRSPVELEDYVDLCERRKIATHTVQAGELDLSTPSGRVMARTLGAFARYEVEHKSARTKRAQLQAAQAGKWLGGALPLGWHVAEDGNAVLDRAAAARIRKATTDVIAGASLGSIVRKWNLDGFTTGSGKPWGYTQLRQVLTRARNAGLIEYNGETVAKSQWPAIVNEDQWRTVCAVLADPTRRKSQSNVVRWLLAGIATCGACGARVRSSRAGTANGAGRTVYRCRTTGAGHVARAGEPVDQYVTEVIARALAEPDAAGLFAEVEGVDVAAARAEEDELRKRMSELAGLFADGAVSVEQLRTATATLRDRLEAVEGALAAAGRPSALAALRTADPAKAFLRLQVDRKRAVVRELCDVVIHPGLRGRDFDPDLVEIRWH
jgi:site-specific DNA recombinase